MQHFVYLIKVKYLGGRQGVWGPPLPTPYPSLDEILTIKMDRDRVFTKTIEYDELDFH